MANYYGNARSNYFAVKDTDAFVAAFAEVPDVELVEDGGKWTMLVSGGDDSGWPSITYNHVTGDDYEIDIPEMVSKHLADGEVAVFMESGAEKLRYIIGFAEAINSDGERVSLDLNNIYELAKTLTNRRDDITRAEY